MNRRDFITRLLGTTAAMAVLPPVIFHTPVERLDALHPKLYTAGWAAIHDKALGCYLSLMEGFRLPVQARNIGMASRLGESVQGVVLAHQFNVRIEAENHQDLIEPAMEALAKRAIERGLDVYGQLLVDIDQVPYAKRRGPLRMIVAFDLYQGSDVLRFDILGGSSPAAKPFVQTFEHQELLRRVERLKRRIHQRLGTYAPVPLPA